MSSYRLSQDVIPSKYDIYIKTDIKSKVFEGEITISFKEVNKTEKAELSCHNSIKVHSVEQGDKKFEFEHIGDKLIIKGTDFSSSPVKIIYTGSLENPNTGFYYINDTTACTQLEATHAREVFPCFDEPCVKATFKLTLAAPKDLVAYSNTPVESTKIDGEYKVSCFKETPTMCTYLFAIAIGNFIQITGKTKSGVDVLVAAVPDKKDYMQRPLEECIKYVEWYEDFTQVPFPLPMLQLVAVPDFMMGAMENFGIVIARESCSLGSEKTTSKRGFIRAMETNCHEIAHQWAGDCVSPKWWNDIWLNEGFATIFPSLVFQDIHKDWDFWSVFNSSDMKYALEFDQSSATHPIHGVYNSDEEIEGAFDDVTYSKAGLFIRMLMHHIGYEKFRETLRVYFKRYIYSNADTQNIENCFSEVMHEDMKPFFDCWTLQAGYPLVTLNDDGTLTQKRFTVNGLMDQKWIIPLFIAIGRKDGTVEERKIIMDKETQKLEIEGEFEWIKLNTNVRSLCRTIVKGKYFDMLIEAIKANKVSETDMFSALYDMFHCAKVGVVSFKDLIKLLKAYRGCDKPLAAQQAASIIAYFYKEFPVLKNEIAAFAKPFLESILDKIGMVTRPEDTLPMTNARLSIILALAFDYGSEKVLAFGKDLYMKYMKRGDYLLPEDVDLNLISFMLKCGSLLVDGGFEYNKKATSESPNPEVAAQSVSSLGFVSKERLPELLQSIEHVKKQDMYTVFVNACVSPNADISIWEYFKEKLPFYLGLFKTTSFILPTMVEYVMDLAQNEEVLADMEKFFESNPVPIAATTISSGTELLHKRFERQKLYCDEIKAEFVI